MQDLLKFESDWQTIQIIENSRSFQGLVDGRGESERRKYISKVGYLYPDRSEKLNAANDLNAMRAALEATPYHACLAKISSDNDKTEVENQGLTIGKYL